MKIAYDWLRSFLDIPADINRHTELLTDIGLEVEGVEFYSSLPHSLDGVVVGEVVSCEQHPDADRLKLTQVDLGNEKVQIVCGAPNVAAGQKVPVATVGTTLYPSEGDALKIKKGKIRGQVSMGMICAEDELGLGKGHDGIMVLDDSLEAGTPFSKTLQSHEDRIIEIGLTPNRCDAMSHMGVARDLRAGLLRQETEIGELITPSISNFHVGARSLQITVDVQQPLLAPHYAGVTLNNIKVDESPEYIKQRLKSIGLSPINNVVDATNYVMHELGQPLHAFDAAKIAGQEIVVKTLPDGTEFVTLDGEKRELDAEDLMICDAEKPLCIAGVFGGLESGVTESTTSIFLESAFFNPVSVRKTAKRHDLKTDASFRFERGIDPDMVKYCLKRAALLIQEIAGGEISMDIVDVYPQTIEDKQVFLPFKQIDRLIGHKIDRDQIKDILATLDIKVNNVTESGMGLTIPAYRHDVERAVDVIEEILRIYGYNNITVPERMLSSIVGRNSLDNLKFKNLVADHLSALGFNEIMNNSLVPENTGTAEVAISMLNPLSSDLSEMRQSLLHGGLESLAYNLNRQQRDLKFYEFGRTYHQKSDKRQETENVGLFITGDSSPSSWNAQQTDADFYVLKGYVAAILQRVAILKYNEEQANRSEFSQAILLEGKLLEGKKQLAVLGQVSDKMLNKYGINQPVYFAELNWDNIVGESSTLNQKLSPIPKFPSVERDLALLVDDQTSFSALKETAQKSEKKLLKSVSLFDVYEGKNLPSGKKSYALRFVLSDEHKTLTDKQIDKVMAKIQKQLETQHAVELR